MTQTTEPGEGPGANERSGPPGAASSCPPYAGWGPYYPYQQWPGWVRHPGDEAGRGPPPPPPPPPVGYAAGPWPGGPRGDGEPWWAAGPGGSQPPERAPRPDPAPGYTSPWGCRHSPGSCSWACWPERVVPWVKSLLPTSVLRMVIGVPMFILISPLVIFGLSNLHRIVGVALGVALWRQLCSVTEQPQDGHRYQGQRDAAAPSAPDPDGRDGSRSAEASRSGHLG